jgi:hypothetical protein
MRRHRDAVSGRRSRDDRRGDLAPGEVRLSRYVRVSAASPSHPGLASSQHRVVGFLWLRRNRLFAVPLEDKMTTTQTTTLNLFVKIVASERSNPPGKLADAELHFTDGVLEGLKLIGFSIWERRTGVGRNVTFPARQYAVNGERRSFALLRPIADATAQDRIRELILEAYAQHEESSEQP